MIQKNITYSIQSTDNNANLSKTINLLINDNTDKQMYIVHRALKQHLNNKRQGSAHTKTRSEVRGGGKKPWKQKGTGRARAGSTRSPLWKGGGVIFGPRTRVYTKKINKKERKLAIKTLIYNKFKNTIIINNFFNKITQPSTRLAFNLLGKLGIEMQKNNKSKVLLIVKDKNSNLYLSVRNLDNLELITANNLNVLSLIKADQILITLEALNTIEKIYDK